MTFAMECPKEQVALALIKRVGLGKPLQVEQLAHAIGRQARTVRGWISAECAPQLGDIWALCRLLGPDFANEIMRPAGLVVAAADDAEAAERLRRVNAAAPALKSLGALADLLRSLE